MILPSRYLLAQGQQYQSNVWNMLKVNNNDTKTASMTFHLQFLDTSFT